MIATLAHTARQVARQTSMLFWVLLLLLAAAEYITAAVQPHLGLAMHAVLLILILIGSACAQRREDRNLALALVLAPLIRLLAVGLPLPALPQLAWYPVVGVPLLAATWLIIRQTGLRSKDLGLRQGDLLVDLALMSGGFVLGTVEHAILRPEPAFSVMTGWYFLAAALSLLIFTGFTEELIFRGVLQNLALPVFGRWGMAYVSVLFGILHIGHLSLADLVFVTVVALVFAQIARRQGSILGVTFSHGITNLTLFVIMPYLHRDRPELIDYFVWGPLAIGTIFSVCTLGYLTARSVDERLKAIIPPPMRPEEAAARQALRALLRETRRGRHLTFAELAQQTGIAERQLLALEAGLARPSDEELHRLGQALDIAPQTIAQTIGVFVRAPA